MPKMWRCLLKYLNLKANFLGDQFSLELFNYPVIKKSNIVVFYENPDFEISDATLDIEYHDESKIPKTMQFNPEKLN